MPGVKIVEKWAFNFAPLTDVECGKLEIIEQAAFGRCSSLTSMNLPSARIVGSFQFNRCRALVDATFGNTLERIEEEVFMDCKSLERISIPFKDGLITDDIFQGCGNLKHVDLVEGELHETISALHLEEWRNDMNEEIDSINQILPDARADSGQKSQVIQRWIGSVMRKIIHYKAEHQRVLSEATVLLELAMWKTNLDDKNGGRNVREGARTRGGVKRARREVCVTSGASIVIKNVLPFLELKP